MERITNKLRAWIELHKLINGKKQIGYNVFVSSWEEDYQRPVENDDYILVGTPGVKCGYETITMNQIQKYIKQIKGDE